MNGNGRHTCHLSRGKISWDQDHIKISPKPCICYFVEPVNWSTSLFHWCLKSVVDPWARLGPALQCLAREGRPRRVRSNLTVLISFLVIVSHFTDIHLSIKILSAHATLMQSYVADELDLLRHLWDSAVQSNADILWQFWIFRTLRTSSFV